MKLTSKLPLVGTTIFTVMSKMALEHNAINLSQGFPNFPVDSLLIDILKLKVSENIHQYNPMAGNPLLLQNISELIQKSYNRNVSPEKEILVTAGATQAIFTTIQALVHSGDEVVILDPSYDCYESPILLADGIPKRIPLDSNFLPDWQLINDTVNAKTRLIITNNPHNPSGKIWTESDVVELETLVQKYPNLLVLSDEVYEYITFENKHISAHERTILHERSIVVSSFGKTFHITGWKIGYLVAPEEIMLEIKKVHQFLVFCVNSVAQSVLADYLPKVDTSKLGEFYQEKRDFFRNGLVNSRFKLLDCEGTYFQLASYAIISNESDIDFTKRLITDFGVAAIPLSVFNADNADHRLIRFCFAKDNLTLTNAMEKLCKI
ncbi:MAG: aminotransferase class I/II-fold pyridoxal phosphate-dependent enzyme [Flavobacteriales bacterium]|nr:aminotransferase class I/II-fold pyridoxal phosphate-dependent enzyme [Crocinitomicaceae bacterium]NBX79245.1 aminotransferase class I/II-fold pyridoxal phosphate-dependent enzyme [Flavobacteriales bacterium]NCA19679.1 aminotransferase class I/II-fold pyridoxal phosphate-dependent enzyme [Crocinitomicaceae bacterium]